MFKKSRFSRCVCWKRLVSICIHDMTRKYKREAAAFEQDSQALKMEPLVPMQRLLTVVAILSNAY